MAGTMLADLVYVLVAGAAATIVAYWLKQPVVLGYLVAGILIGPHALGFVRELGTIEELAHLGIIFLMLGVGLEFDLKKLRNVGARAVAVAAIQIGVMIGAGYAAGRYLGWTPMDSIFLGAIISISSTVIIVKVLTETGKLKEEHGQLALGVLIIEDIAAISMVSVLGALGATGQLSSAVLATTIASILLFVFLFLAVGLVLVPRFFEWVSRFRVEEVLLVSVVGLAFASALLAERLGFSLALGAFLVGGILAESRAGKRIEHHLVPIRDLFTATFFVAVGMMLRPSDLVTYAWPILVVTLVTLGGKFLGVALGALLAGYDGRTSVKTAASMAQIGEFGFIIASLGLTLEVIRPEIHPIAVAVCAITSLTTPFLIRGAARAVDRLGPKIPARISRAIASYGRLVRRDGHSFVPPADAERARQGARLIVYAAWTIATTLAAFLLAESIARHLGGLIPLGVHHMKTPMALIMVIAAAPFAAGFQNSVRAMMHLRARHRTHSIHDILRPIPTNPARAAGIAGAFATVGLSAASAGIGMLIAQAPIVLAILSAALITTTTLLMHRGLPRWIATMEKLLDLLLHPSRPLLRAPGSDRSA